LTQRDGLAKRSSDSPEFAAGQALFGVDQAGHAVIDRADAQAVAAAFLGARIVSAALAQGVSAQRGATASGKELLATAMAELGVTGGPFGLRHGPPKERIPPERNDLTGYRAWQARVEPPFARTCSSVMDWGKPNSRDRPVLTKLLL